MPAPTLVGAFPTPALVFFGRPLVELLVNVLPLLQLPTAAQLLLQQHLSVLVQLLDGLLRLLAGHSGYVELPSR